MRMAEIDLSVQTEAPTTMTKTDDPADRAISAADSKTAAGQAMDLQVVQTVAEVAAAAAVVEPVIGEEMRGGEAVEATDLSMTSGPAMIGMWVKAATSIRTTTMVLAAMEMDTSLLFLHWVVVTVLVMEASHIEGQVYIMKVCVGAMCGMYNLIREIIEGDMDGESSTFSHVI